MESVRRDNDPVVQTLLSSQTFEGIIAALAILMRAVSYLASRSGSVTRAPRAEKTCTARARVAGFTVVPTMRRNGSRHESNIAVAIMSALSSALARPFFTCVSRAGISTKEIAFGLPLLL